MERIDDIDPVETERCMYQNAECKDLNQLSSMTVSIEVLKFCQNCLSGKLIEELRRLRITGIQL